MQEEARISHYWVLNVGRQHSVLRQAESLGPKEAAKSVDQTRPVLALKHISYNTGKLELPPISQVQSREVIDEPWYTVGNTRSAASYQELPTLDTSRLQDTDSSKSPSPRSDAYGASSAGHSSKSSQTSYAPSLNGVYHQALETPPPEGAQQTLDRQSYFPANARPPQHLPHRTQQAYQGYGSGSEYFGSMSQTQPYMDVHHNHISSSQHHPPSSALSGLSHYVQYPHPPPLQPGHQSFSSAPGAYSQYGYGGSQLASPQSGAHQSSSMMGLPLGQNSLSLPAMSAAPPGPAMGGASGYPPQSFDTTGQIAPPGMKPRVTATLWEDEGSLCFQVEAKGVCVARRDDNHMINGTKLLNVAGMTRGRRDGILKSEKTRHVKKIGPMHLKGVWIPFERALDFANKEKITDLLYPLFVHDIGALLYHPSNQSRANVSMGAAERRRNDQQQQAQYLRSTPGSQPPTLHHHHTMHNPVGAHLSQTSQTTTGSGRPGIDRAHTFPTPPTSASSLMGLGNQPSSYEWGASNSSGVPSTQSLSIETGLTARSMPTTPASTPPGSSLHNMQQYQTTHGYDSSRQIYSAPPLQQYPYGVQSNASRYQNGPSGGYGKGDMAPPGRAPTEDDSKDPNLVLGHGRSNEQAGEEEAEHEHDNSYNQSNSHTYGGNRNYGPGSNLSLEMTHSPAQSGRATPRTATSAAQWPAGYGHIQRTQSSSGALYSEHASAGTNGNGTDTYHATAYAQHSYQPTNGAPPSSKRVREIDDDDDDDYNPGSRGNSDAEGLKRRKTSTGGGAVEKASLNRTRSAISQRRR